jgi:hypothetical protein
MEKTGKTLLMNYSVMFDGGDVSNGSLYLCLESRETAAELFASAIARLRRRGLWSEEPSSQVKDSQREAYCEQLQFIASKTVQVDGCPLVLARFDHPKYPSNAERFDAWISCLSAA